MKEIAQNCAILHDSDNGGPKSRAVHLSPSFERGFCVLELREAKNPLPMKYPFKPGDANGAGLNSVFRSVPSQPETKNQDSELTR
jgi:hypothetical protein